MHCKNDNQRLKFTVEFLSYAHDAGCLIVSIRGMGLAQLGSVKEIAVLRNCAKRYRVVKYLLK